MRLSVSTAREADVAGGAAATATVVNLVVIPRSPDHKKTPKHASPYKTHRASPLGSFVPNVVLDFLGRVRNFLREAREEDGKVNISQI